MNYESFSARLTDWLYKRYIKEFDGFQDNDDVVFEPFFSSVYEGIVRNVFEAQPIEDVCEWLLDDEEALEFYFSTAVMCAQRVYDSVCTSE